MNETSSNPKNPISKDWFHRHKLFLATLVILICGAGLIFQWKLNYFRARVNTDFPVRESAASSIPADWENYANPTHAYKVSYPKDYEVRLLTPDGNAGGQPNQGSSTVRVAQKDLGPGEDKMGKVVISIVGTGESAQAWFDRVYSKSRSGYDIAALADGGLIATLNNGTGDLENAYKIKILKNGAGVIEAAEDIQNPVLETILQSVSFDEDGSKLQTYSNQQYGFSFEYPQSWPHIEEMPTAYFDYMPEGRQTVFIYSTVYPGHNYSAQIDVYDVSQDVVIKDYPDRVARTHGQSVNEWTKFQESGDDYLLYLREHNGKTYAVSGPDYLVNQILSTFKFTDDYGYVNAYIENKYPNSQKTQMALKQSAQSIENLISRVSDKDYTSNAEKQVRDANDCLEYVLGTQQASAAFGDILSQVLNTKEKSEAYVQAGSYLHGGYMLTPLEDEMKKCNFNPDSLPN